MGQHNLCFLWAYQVYSKVFIKISNIIRKPAFGVVQPDETQISLLSYRIQLESLGFPIQQLQEL